MAVTKEEVVEFISNMTVLELSEFIKELEEKFGVSAAAPAAAMVMAAPGAAAVQADSNATVSGEDGQGVVRAFARTNFVNRVLRSKSRLRQFAMGVLRKQKTKL